MNSSASSIASIYSSKISPKKNLSLFQSDQIRDNPISKADAAFAKELEKDAVTPAKPVKIPRDRKNFEISSIPESTKGETDYKSPRDAAVLKKVELRTPKVNRESKSPSTGTRPEFAKFSPYMLPQKGPEEYKPKQNAASAKKSDTPKPAKNSVVENVAVKGNTATKKKEPHYFTFALGKGNNDQIIRKVMSKRFWWKETYPSNTVFDFAWQPTSRSIEFSQLHAASPLRRMVNHFEYNSEIGTKNNLIKNLQPYCDKKSIDLFRITPVTFILDLDDPYFAADYKVFVKYFKEFGKSKEDIVEENKLPADASKGTPQSRGKSYVPQVSQKQLQAKLPETYYDGCNLWLLKPADYNRGQGINLFNKLTTLEHYLKCSYKGGDDQKPEGNNQAKNANPTPSIVMCHKFVVQKYIERPLLIEGRKFDARVWVLIDHEMNLYMFKESYLRLSSEVFNLDETRLEDKYVHLTNNAVQKYSENYGKHESGNIISLNELERYLPKDRSDVTLEGVKKKIKDLIRMTMECVRNKLNPSKRKFCFELFGYDFILDADYNVYVIEVNSNPSIEVSNDLLGMLIPRMIDDTIKLTVDKIFVPNLKNFDPEEGNKEGIDKDYPVTGYGNEENLWEHLVNLKEPNKAKE